MNIQPPDLNEEALEAKVAINGHRIQCTTRDYCPHLVPVMRSVHYEFNKPPPVWYRVCSERHGDINHRAAELVLVLLHAGIPVECADEVADLALSGAIEPEYPRWIHLDSKLINHLAIEGSGLIAIWRSGSPMLWSQKGMLWRCSVRRCWKRMRMDWTESKKG